MHTLRSRHAAAEAPMRSSQFNDLLPQYSVSRTIGGNMAPIDPVAQVERELRENGPVSGGAHLLQLSASERNRKQAVAPAPPGLAGLRSPNGTGFAAAAARTGVAAAADGNVAVNLSPNDDGSSIAPPAVSLPFDPSRRPPFNGAASGAVRGAEPSPQSPGGFANHADASGAGASWGIRTFQATSSIEEDKQLLRRVQRSALEAQGRLEELGLALAKVEAEADSWREVLHRQFAARHEAAATFPRDSVMRDVLSQNVARQEGRAADIEAGRIDSVAGSPPRAGPGITFSPGGALPNFMSADEARAAARHAGLSAHAAEALLATQRDAYVLRSMAGGNGQPRGPPHPQQYGLLANSPGNATVRQLRSDASFDQATAAFSGSLSRSPAFARQTTADPKILGRVTVEDELAALRDVSTLDVEASVARVRDAELRLRTLRQTEATLTSELERDRFDKLRLLKQIDIALLGRSAPTANETLAFANFGNAHSEALVRVVRTLPHTNVQLLVHTKAFAFFIGVLQAAVAQFRRYQYVDLERACTSGMHHAGSVLALTAIHSAMADDDIARL